VKSAKLTLGTYALREGDVKTAVRYLNEAGAISASIEGRWSDSLENRLVHNLLKAGERESVAGYLEKVATLEPELLKEHKLKDAAAIRAGMMPEGFQSMMARN
jgi:hypothetical protein